VPVRYLIVDGHSIIFAWPKLRDLHARRPYLAREALIKELRHYQDWTGVHVAVVFDGQGDRVSEVSDPYDRTTCKFSTPAVANQRMRSLSDWQANMDRGSK